MFRKYFLREAKSANRDSLAFSFLLINALSWFFMTSNILNTLLTDLGGAFSQTIIVMLSYYFAIVCSSLFGALLSSRMQRRSLFSWWTVFGIVASLLPFLVVADSVEALAIISFWFGFSFGFGMPSCLAYFADGTTFENRGGLAGLIFFLTGGSAFVFTVFNLLADSSSSALLYMAIWRGLSLSIFRLTHLQTIEVKRSEHTSFRLIVSRPFLFYFIPYLMFSLVDSFEKTYLRFYIQASFGSGFFEFNQLAETMIGAISAIVIGIVADFVGRKRVIVYGFVSLGLAYAMVGLSPLMGTLWYFYTVIDGIAWGIFFVMFTFLIWGDLSPPGSFRERFYVLGSMPFFFSKIVEVILLPYTQELPQESAYAAFSLAAFFLFLAVVPLMYAPETLPEKQMRERELKGYVEKAKKIAEKRT